jgi:hypothetical protein
MDFFINRCGYNIPAVSYNGDNTSFATYLTCLADIKLLTADCVTDIEIFAGQLQLQLE